MHYSLSQTAGVWATMISAKGRHQYAFSLCHTHLFHSHLITDIQSFYSMSITPAGLSFVGSYRATNTVNRHYKHQLIYVISWNNSCLLWGPWEIRENCVQNAQFEFVWARGRHSNDYALNSFKNHWQVNWQLLNDKYVSNDSQLQFSLSPFYTQQNKQRRTKLLRTCKHLL